MLVEVFCPHSSELGNGNIDVQEDDVNVIVRVTRRCYRSNSSGLVLMLL